MSWVGLVSLIKLGCLVYCVHAHIVFGNGDIINEVHETKQQALVTKLNICLMIKNYQ
jgi:hypothetical protein